jgi:hypothetical protein
MLPPLLGARSVPRMSETDSLDEATADLFSLDLTADPDDDLPGDTETSGNCTDNGCTQTCRGC